VGCSEYITLSVEQLQLQGTPLLHSSRHVVPIHVDRVPGRDHISVHTILRELIHGKLHLGMVSYDQLVQTVIEQDHNQSTSAKPARLTHTGQAIWG